MSTWNLSTTGSDTTGDGSIGNPYATIEKCVTESSNGDSIKYADGTYSISSTANINKQLTISGHTGIPASVILDSTVTVFNVQESNVSFDNLTMDTTNTTPLVTFDRDSTGTTEPTFTIGNSIDNCIIKFIKNALTINGGVVVINNTFTRNDSGSETADIITVYSTRTAFTVSNNTLTSDAYAIRYFIWFTSTGTGDYVDWANSKSGVVTISTNTINSTDTTQLLTFMQLDYFNQYDYGPNAVSVEAYNTNTKVRMVVDNNTMSMGMNGKFVNIYVNNSSNFYMFEYFNIHTNTIISEHGVVHLDKDTGTTSAITVDVADQARSVLKIYGNNNSNYTLYPSSLHFDVSVASSLYSDLGKTTNSILDGGSGGGGYVRIIDNQADITGDATDVGTNTGFYQSDTIDSTPTVHIPKDSGYSIVAPLYYGAVDITVAFVTRYYTTPQQVIFTNFSTGGFGDENNILLLTSNNRVSLFVHNNITQQSSITNSVNRTANERLIIVFNINTSTNVMNLWVNEEKVTGSYTGTIIPSTEGIFIGKFPNSLDSMYGDLYEFKIFDGVLSDSAIYDISKSLAIKWDILFPIASNLHLDASNLASLIGQTGTGTEITQWDDISGDGNFAVGAGSSNSPAPLGDRTVYESTAFNGGYPCIRFGPHPSTNGYWTMRFKYPYLFYNQTEFVFYFIGQVAGVGEAHPFYVNAPVGGSSYILVSGGTYENIGLAARTSGILIGVTGSTPLVYAIRGDASNGTRIYVNDMVTPAHSATFSSITFSEPWSIGQVTTQGVGQLGINGYIAEMRLQLTSMTDNDFQTMMSAVKTKWGF